MTTSLVDAVCHAAGQGRGAIISGPRYVGKSYLAKQITSQLSQSRYFAFQLPVRRLEARNANSKAIFPSYLRDKFCAGSAGPNIPQFLIIDDAELLIATLVDRGDFDFYDYVGELGATLILIRNQYVSEGRGYFAERERELAEELGLQSFRIPFMVGSDARDIARQLLKNRKYLENDSLSSTLLTKYAGPFPSLMTELIDLHLKQAPTPAAPHLHTTSAELAISLASRFRLSELDRSQTIFLAINDLLPPPGCLQDRGLSEVGFLRAIGMFADEYWRDNAFSTNLWYEAARHVSDDRRDPLEMSFRSYEIEEGPGMAVARRLDRSKWLRSFQAYHFHRARTDGRSRQPKRDVDFSDAMDLNRIVVANRLFPHLVKPLSQILAESIGRYGLVESLRIDFRKAQELSARALGEELLSDTRA